MDGRLGCSSLDLTEQELRCVASGRSRSRTVPRGKARIRTKMSVTLEPRERHLLRPSKGLGDLTGRSTVDDGMIAE